MSKEFLFRTTDNESIRITSFGIENISEGNCIIFVHGFKGFKDWGFGPHLGNYLAAQGFFVITFNFSHNGIGEEKNEFTELHKFRTNTFSREVRELSEIIDAYNSGFFGNNQKNKIGLLGHSRGGAVSILTASKNSNVDALVTWSAIAKLDRYSERQKKDWKEKGVFEIENARTKQIMPLGIELLKDIEENGNDFLNLKIALRDLDKPLLIVHGDQDLAVPLHEGEQLFEWSDKNLTEMFIVQSAGHTFNIKHPFEGSNEQFDLVLAKTNEFFKTKLNNS
ncbi:MAG: alpha/beta fold hydrolase [Melioribacteraceae bacterium]|nr:alpha/beta fold hydrolase [Melioribacteraceae bacterium]MCF8353448.1 alpha/beta fold hydrolase [Melioribacteraceae bacterium]MCF8393936.1 alpha/beta fold hydrolase [Melioribacteraceae bacterium]MCF8419009.1 alpha/beta fold hydrolase [Melioribacteraceae bacterium]